jgi:ankyrin repeat protein
VNTVVALLDAGASVGIENDFGRTALHVAAVAGHVEVCLVLLRAGADL